VFGPELGREQVERADRVGLEDFLPGFHVTLPPRVLSS
jgi:hypothetical protein